MIGKHILLITYLNEPEITSFHTLKWFQVLLSNKNNSVYYESFFCTQLNGSKYCYVSQTIQLNTSHSYTQLNDQTVLF